LYNFILFCPVSNGLQQAYCTYLDSSQLTLTLLIYGTVHVMRVLIPCDSVWFV